MKTKKTYMAPVLEVVVLKYKGMLCNNSPLRDGTQDYDKVYSIDEND